MSYTRPAHSATDFAFDGVAYTRPSSTATAFSFVPPGTPIEGSGAATLTLLVAGSGGFHLQGSAATTLNLLTSAYGLVYNGAELTFALAPISGPPYQLLFGEYEGLTSIEGSVALSLSLPTVAATGGYAPLYDGTVALSLSLPTVAATGDVPVIYEGTASFVLTGPTVSATGDWKRVFNGTVAAVLGLPTVAGTGDKNINTPDRPTVAQAATRHQVAQAASIGAQTSNTSADPARADGKTSHSPALPRRGWASSRHTLGLGRREVAASRHGLGAPVNTRSATRHQDAARLRTGRRTRHEVAIPTGFGVGVPHSDMLHGSRPVLRSGHEIAVPRSTSRSTSAGVGVPFRKRWNAPSQDAIRPPAGRYTPPEPPLPPSCYDPDAHLVFKSPPVGPHLVFVCDNYTPPLPPGQVIVPVRKVYVVLNNVLLRRVSGNVDLLALDLSMSLDADSWTWSFNARLPLRSEDDVMPSAGEPVEVEAVINGTAYRLLVESVSRERSFGSTSVRVGGRGKSALLASPYSAVTTFTNDIARTAEQLMLDALTENGVPLPWSVDFQLTDWLVPAGAFSVQGSYIDALNAVAGAVGGYIQPHPNQEVLYALPRYPVAPWEWATATPDIELPSAVTTREGIEWRNNPEYNRVYVSGQGQGILGQVTRMGTPGDLAAQMVVDPLITHLDAARQRGLAVIGAGGNKANVSLTLPVLNSTGVIHPGKLVRYVDGATSRTGLVRSTSVNASMPTLRQTIVLETQA